ncbi:MAG: S41 family peptidase [Solirubrobacteraceae bacterium]
MSPRTSRSPLAVVYVSLGLVLLLAGIWLGGHPSWLPSPLRNALVDDGNGGLVNEALSLLSRDYYRPINRGQLVDKGLAGAVASLNDPYSHYFDPTDYRSFLSQSNPHLSGVGVDVQLEPKGLRVVGVYAGSPAARAGLAGGNLIISVGSTSLANRSETFGSSLIKGKAGTQVKLTILSGRRRRTVTITRADIVVPVAAGTVATVHGDKVGIVRLTSFTDGSGAEVRSQVQRVLHRGARALVLDLRQNGGGLLNEAVNVASVFIPDGTIVSTVGRSQPRQVYVAKEGAISGKIPLVVLVDQGTASSAEIVTGALRDRGRAKVVGTRTYGKGVFQAIQSLSNGGALDIVTGQWFEPSGRNVGGPGVKEGAGISPDVHVAARPHAPGDPALTTAERTVTAEIR